MIDGRSIYSPIDKGVFWDEQNLPLEDIERIEVVRDPGATLWGANAVNGVVNILTKTAAATQGSLMTAGIGDQGQSIGGLRYGGKLGESGNYRVYSRYMQDSPVVSGEIGSQRNQLAQQWISRGLGTRQRHHHGRRRRAYYTAALPGLAVAAYMRMDARLGTDPGRISRSAWLGGIFRADIRN
jgi:outer membrane cobalamin receptor